MPQNRSVLHILRQYSDDQLLALLAARPDLATPPPGSLAGLAARALTRPSLERAIAGLNTFELQVLESVAVLTHSLPVATLTPTVIRRALGRRVPAARVREAINGLKEKLLLSGSATDLHAPAEVFAALGPFPAGLGPSLTETLTQRGDLTDEERELWTAQLTSAQHLTELLAQAPKRAHRVLELLTWGPPIGDRGSAGGSDNSPLTWLISRGLLATAGEQHVALPREIALFLRDGQTHKSVTSEPPALEAHPPTGYRPMLGEPQAFVDASAGERATEVLQLVDLLIEEWEEGGPALRTGGIGLREMRRLANALGIDEPEVAFLFEVSAAAQLLALTDDEKLWVPSREHLIWAQREAGEKWVQLAWAWLNSPRATWLIGQRDQGRIIAPLQSGIDRAWIPHLRERTLSVLAQTQRGAVPNHADVYAQLKWHSPKSAPHEVAVHTFLEHAQWLGVLGARSLTSATRHLLEAARAGDLQAEDTAIAKAVAAVNAALPAEVAQIMVQGDLSIIIPGRPAPNLEWVAQVAHVEQRGAAQVLRLTEDSVRAAMQRGWTASKLVEKLGAAATTELPQPVAYLIADVERQFGRVRAHSVQSVIATADPASATEILADANLVHLAFERVAPTVLISRLPTAEVVETLRSHGHAPITDHVDNRGTQGGRRRPSARGSLQVGQPVSIILDDAAPHRALMAIRAGEKQAASSGPDPLIARQRLTAMHDQGRAGWLTLVDGGGKSQRRLVRV
ncbi:MAG TPA: helicase-associated domain-containing protein, partial [Actinomycetales bacterium]|nr:helicase-associated domain-containing protein [Actinomycetales bacterium]